MRSVAGILFSLLVGKRLSKGSGPAHDHRSPLLRMTRPVRTVHLMPGRVRFRVEAMRGRAEAAERLEAQIGRIEGVARVQANPVTGSVLVQYDDSVLEPELLLAALIKVLGLEEEMERTPVPRVAEEMREILQAVNRAVFDQTRGLLDLWTTASLLAAVAGLNRLTRGSVPWPHLFGLLWWMHQQPGRVQGGAPRS